MFDVLCFMFFDCVLFYWCGDSEQSASASPDRLGDV